jgi:hypothetical protein
MGFRALETDPIIYVRGNIIIGVYVDDILACSLSISACNPFISELAQKIEVVNKGEVRSFLGISVTRNYPLHAISIGQPGIKHNMTNAKSASTPFEKGTKLKSATKNDTLCNLKSYQEFTGSLNHLSVFTKPDIAFAISKLSKFNADPRSFINAIQSRYRTKLKSVTLDESIKNSLSITSLSSESRRETQYQRLHTSQPRLTSFDASNQLAIIILSTDVHQPSRLPISSAIQMRTSHILKQLHEYYSSRITNSLSISPCFSPHRKSNGARDSSDNPAKYR